MQPRLTRQTRGIIMGLFSNNKKLCPICGSPTPRFLKTKVEGMPLCDKCASKADLPEGMLDSMTLEDFRQYIAFYDENRALRDAFTETGRMSFGLFGPALCLDSSHGLFRLRGGEDALVFQASHLKGFRIMEDNKPLFESVGGVLRCHQSDVPARINMMSPQIAQFVMQQQMQEEMERRRKKDGESGTGYYRQVFEMPVPFRHFCVELTLEHPYWSSFRGRQDGPALDQYYPSIENYLEEYRAATDELHVLASSLMQMIRPGAQEAYDGQEMPGVAAEASGLSAADEIKKYKALLDDGIITEEEFAAKKRQLLGI